MPTLSMSTLWEVSMAFKPPRTVFLDFPLGCPAGKPHDSEMQRAVLRSALAAAPTFDSDWKIVELPFQWSADGSRQWEEEVRELYRRGLSTVSRHVADHQTVGESLLDNEKEFSIRCHC
jgi:D-proline reductase (dithiol) PrdB